MIKLKEKIGYGLGDMASSMFWKLFGSYLMIFYTDVFGMSAAVVGTMFLVTRVWDSAFDPIVGIIADRTHSRWGKFRPYLLFLAFPFAFIGILTFTTPEWSMTAKIVYAYITYSLMMMVYSAINVPYASLLGVMSAEPHDRNVLSVYRMVFAYLGSFIALLLFMPMVNAFSEGHGEQYGWEMAVTVIAVMCTVFFIGCFALTRERVKPIREKQAPLKDDLKDLLHNRPWWILLGAGIAALIFNSIRDGATVYYFKYFIVENSNEPVTFLGIPFVLSGLYLAIGQAANIIGVVLAAPVSNRIGKKRTYMCNRATGLIFSSSSMSQKFGWAIGSAVTGWLLGYFGFQANVVQNDQAINGIRMFLSFLPAIGTLLSILFISMYPLSERRMKEIIGELEQKRNQH